MGSLRDLTGQTFGRLTVLTRGENSPAGQARWNCVCACGTVVPNRASIHLLSGHTKSCGCLNAEMAAARSTTHGMSGTKEHGTWKKILSRCYNKRDPKYKDYGGRGISVCDRWRESFESFFSDMGYAPSQLHSIDRVKNEGNYEPTNCRWATEVEQANNKRNNLHLEYRGTTKTLAQWCDTLKLVYSKVQLRLARGWTVDLAFEAPNGTRLSSLNRQTT